MGVFLTFNQKRENKWEIFSNFCGLFRKLELYCKEMGRRLCDRMTWIFNDSSSFRLSLGGLKATFRYNARGKSYSSKGCPFVLGCIERLVSPNRECVWRPTFAGSPLPARKFPSKRCHLPPPEKQPCSLVHSLVALLAKPFSLPTQSCEDKFPPFFAGKMCHGRKIYTTTNLGFLVYTM